LETYAANLPDERRSLIREHVRLAYLAGGVDGPRSMTANGLGRAGRRSPGRDLLALIAAQGALRQARRNMGLAVMTAARAGRRMLLALTILTPSGQKILAGERFSAR